MWIYFVLLASLTWSFTNVFDKFLIDKRVDKPLILTIFIRVGSVIPLLLILPFVSFSLPGAEFVFWIFLAGIFAAAGVIIFYKAIQIEEVSRTIPLFQFIPVFVLFLSFLLIGEVLGLFDYVGFIVLITGGLVITAKRLSRLLNVERVFWLVILSSLLHAVSYVIMKHVLTNVEYWSAFILLWILQAVIILSLLGSRKIRRDAKFYIKKITFRDKIIILADSVISLLAFILNYFAISLGPVTLVEAAGNIQLVFIFLLALFLTRFFPGILREKFDRKITMQKIAGIVLIITGILLTQLF
jgi:drug/metabolite transporter (DMT)-like permease